MSEQHDCPRCVCADEDELARLRTLVEKAAAHDGKPYSANPNEWPCESQILALHTRVESAEADAAKWRLVKETARRVWNAGGEEELHIVVMGDSTLHLIPCENEADAVRYRKIKAAVEAGERFTAFQDKYGAVARVGVAGLGMPYASGPTLDEAVDQLPEAT